jgi:YVTN family beta-propeller protein
VSQLRLAVPLALWLALPAAAWPADGSVNLYLQPFPPGAARLALTIASVAAVSASGSLVPLDVRLRVLDAAAVRRQRLLAAGRLPAGRYTGFAVTIERASLARESGEAALLVPDEPVRLDVPFVVSGRQAPLFWLALDDRESVGGGSVLAPIFSISSPPRPIAAHAGFVTNTGSSSITVFDKHLGQAVALLDACTGPAGMALDRRRGRLFVACSGDDEIQAIDVAAGEVVERARLFPGDGPLDIALTPDGATLLSVNARSNTVGVLDAASLARLERIPVGTAPGAIALDGPGRRAFIFNTLSNTISVVDIASRSVIATISTDAPPARGQLDRRGDRLYVIHERSPILTVLDAQRLAVVTRTRVPIGTRAIEVDAIRGLVYVGGRHDAAIEAYDPQALVPIHRIETAAGVSYMAMDAEDDRLYMVNPETRRLIVGRLADRTIATEIDVGDGPCRVAVMGGR